MAYIALYRRWRPQEFDNLVGQDHISKTLANAIKNDKIAHAYLFSGPRGTGKTSTAKILAKALNCIEGPTPTPCNKCDSCLKINEGSSMDVFEIDAASNRGIDEIRDLRESVKFSPVDGKYKIYIIDEVHMLTTEAFNALLKTLEEPPSHVVFILATTESHKIPATIHSRCQRYDFRKITVNEILTRLQQVAETMNVEIEKEALITIAHHADGGMRDALSILDQCSAFAESIKVDDVRSILGLIGREWIWSLIDAISEKNTKESLQLVEEILSKGKDIKQILIELAQYFREIMIYQVDSQVDDFVNEEATSQLKKHSRQFSYDELVENIKNIHEGINELRFSPQPRITLEVLLVTLCNLNMKKNHAALLERIEILEAKIKNGVVPQSSIKQTKMLTENISSQKSDEVAQIKSDEVYEVPEESKIEPEKIQRVQFSGNGDKIWEGLLNDLANSGKMSILACVKQGNLIVIENNQAIIEFSTVFLKERTEKDDYREIIEEIMKKISGQEIKIKCVLKGEVVNRKPSNDDHVAEVKVDKDHPSLKAAIKMFGDNVISE